MTVYEAAKALDRATTEYATAMIVSKSAGEDLTESAAIALQHARDVYTASLSTQWQDGE